MIYLHPILNLKTEHVFKEISNKTLVCRLHSVES
mgnify:CR=1 FL=1